MKRLLAIVVVATTVGLGGYALASAHGGSEDRPSQSPGMMGVMGGMMGGGQSAGQLLISLALQSRDQLGLSRDQVAALESLRSEFQEEAIRRSADLQIAEQELAELLRSDPADLAKVETKLRQVEALRTDIRLGRIKTLEKGKALLTPEQRKKLDSLAPRASVDSSRGMMGGQGMEEMQRFMSSERMPQAMGAMMEMARQMGNGDPMAGMVRMMGMMSMMGQMGGQGGMGGMMGPSQPQPSK